MSFWDDVIIGKGSKGCSATHIIDLPDGGYISGNSVSYWVTLNFLRIGMTIMKGTNQFEIVKEGLERKHAAEYLNDRLTKIAIEQMGPADLMEKIEAYGNKRFAEGCDHQQAVIRAALGV